MIDVKQLQSSSLFAGFANLGSTPGQINIPAGQTLGAFGSLIFTFDIPRVSLDSMQQVSFQLIGPTTSWGDPHNSSLWKSSSNDFCDWSNVDSSGIDIRCDILYSADIVRLRVVYQEIFGGTPTYNVPIIVNAKVYSFKYPWE